MIIRSLCVALALATPLSSAQARDYSDHDGPMSRPSDNPQVAQTAPRLGRLLRHDMADPPIARASGIAQAFQSSQADGLGEDEILLEGTGADADEGKASATPSLQGLVTFVAEGARFLDCKSGASFPIEESGDFEALEHAYLAAGNEPGVSVFATFEGEIVESDTGQNDGKEAVHVSRFLGVWPEVNCDRATSEVSLTNTYWKIMSLFGTEVSTQADGKEPHMILLGEEGRFTATVGCNQFMGSFELSGSGIVFGPGAASTRMACRDPLGEWEVMLGKVISGAVRWSKSGDKLSLIDADGEPIAEFEAVSLN